MFFKKIKIKEFMIPVRYWDEEKEKNEARERRIKMELGTLKDENYVVPDLHGAFTRKPNRYRSLLEKQRKRSLIRLIIIILVLFMLVYVFFGQDYLLELF